MKILNCLFEGIYEEFMGANDKKDLARLEAQFQDNVLNFSKKGDDID